MGEKIRELTVIVIEIVGMVLMLTSCFPNIKTRETKYVSPNDQVALIFEYKIRFDVENEFTNKSYPDMKFKEGDKKIRYKIFGLLFKVDGKGIGGNACSCGEEYCWELAPGLHIFEIKSVGGGSKEDVSPKTFGLPLTIELNALAGHNYRIWAHAYDERTVSLYIEDINTHEVVSGHHPEKENKP